MKVKYLNNKLVVLGVLLVISIVIMRFFDAPLKNEVCKNGIVSFELAKDIFNTKAIINSWNKEAKSSAFYSLLFDFVFILIYTTFLVWLIQKTKFRGKKIVLYFVVFAGFFDFIENLALLNLLKGNLVQINVSVAYYFASFKFLLLLIAIVYLLFYGLFSLYAPFKKSKINH